MLLCCGWVFSLDWLLSLARLFSVWEDWVWVWECWCWSWCWVWLCWCWSWLCWCWSWLCWCWSWLWWCWSWLCWCWGFWAEDIVSCGGGGLGGLGILIIGGGGLPGIEVSLEGPVSGVASPGSMASSTTGPTTSLMRPPSLLPSSLLFQIENLFHQTSNSLFLTCPFSRE